MFARGVGFVNVVGLVARLGGVGVPSRPAGEPPRKGEAMATERIRKFRAKATLFQRLADRDGGWRCTYCQTELDPLDPDDPPPLEDPDRVVFRGMSDYRWGREPEPFVERLPWATLDHRIPLSRGGTDDLSNLAMACQSCNASKGPKTPAEFTAWRDRQPVVTTQ